jgi:hypothetical protein
VSCGGSRATFDLEAGKVIHKDVPMRNVLNEALRTEYIKDCQRGAPALSRRLSGCEHEARAEEPQRHLICTTWLSAPAPETLGLPPDSPFL